VRSRGRHSRELLTRGVCDLLQAKKGIGSTETEKDTRRTTSEPVTTKNLTQDMENIQKVVTQKRKNETKSAVKKKKLSHKEIDETQRLEKDEEKKGPGRVDAHCSLGVRDESRAASEKRRVVSGGGKRRIVRDGKKRRRPFPNTQPRGTKAVAEKSQNRKTERKAAFVSLESRVDTGKEVGSLSLKTDGGLRVHTGKKVEQRCRKQRLRGWKRRTRRPLTRSC